MWFRFPRGTSGVSVELQEFSPEVEDAEGLGYFRAPDYLSAKILDLPGFVRLDPPEGLTDLGDIPPSNSTHGQAIVDLTAQVTAITQARDDAVERLTMALSQIEMLGDEIKRLKEQIALHDNAKESETKKK